MTRDESDEKELYEATLHETYFRIAIDSFSKAKTLSKELSEIKTDSDKGFVHFMENSKRIAEYEIIVVIFCALTAEAFMNHYAVERLSRNYFDKYLDKLSLMSKWVIIPKIIIGEQLDPGSGPLQALNELVRLRHKLVHYKVRQSSSVEKMIEESFPNKRQVEEAIKTVAALLRELSKLDGSVESEWVMAAIGSVGIRHNIDRL